MKILPFSKLIIFIILIALFVGCLNKNKELIKNIHGEWKSYSHDSEMAILFISESQMKISYFDKNENEYHEEFLNYSISDNSKINFSNYYEPAFIIFKDNNTIIFRPTEEKIREIIDILYVNDFKRQ